MRRISLFHLINIALFAMYCLLVARALNLHTLIYWVVWLIYAGAFFGLLKKHVRRTRFLVLPPLLIFAITAPGVIYNFYAFLSGNLRYVDSPATIIVVGIFALLTTLPSALVLSSYWIYRQSIFGYE